jgi:Ser/Thr protein kinase RdoA (MazF antagonist)
MYQLIKKALKPYSLGNESLLIEKELHPDSWNSDLHYKIVVDGKPFSARFIRNNRSPHHVFGEISNEILFEQTKFCSFLVNNEVPFMNLLPISEDLPFITVEWENEIYRFILFEWIEGKHITHCNEYIAEEFGKMARKFHDVSSLYKSSVFPKKSHLVGYSQFVDNLRSKVKSLETSSSSLIMVENYLETTEHHIEKAKTNQFDFIVQSDLNPLNVIWDENKEIIGIVDFESIGYSDRIEGLAWLIKWYSRTNGIDSTEMSPIVADAFIKGYKMHDFLDANDMFRLSSLIWLSGCMNWNFVRSTIKIIETNNDEQLKNHLAAYKQRGKELLALIP